MTSDDISEALHKLAAEGSADQIAAALLAQDCRGIPGLVDRCPVANYVRAAVTADVEIEGAWWALDDGSALLLGPLPAEIQAFVEFFDEGRYPQLNSRPDFP